MLCTNTAKRHKIDTSNTLLKHSYSLHSLSPMKVWTSFKISLTTRLTQRSSEGSRAIWLIWKIKQSSLFSFRVSCMISCIQLILHIKGSVNSWIPNPNPDRQTSLQQLAFISSMSWKEWPEAKCDLKPTERVAFTLSILLITHLAVRRRANSKIRLDFKRTDNEGAEDLLGLSDWLCINIRRVNFTLSFY